MDILKVPKLKRKVSLWIHPVGQVIGSLFVREQSLQHDGEEQLVEALNENIAFVVLEKNNPEQLCFYNRNSIIRVEYTDDSAVSDMLTLSCELHMMDGAIISGNIHEDLPQDQSRLFDYLNQQDNRFIKLYTAEHEVCLINKSYINNVISLN